MPRFFLWRSQAHRKYRRLFQPLPVMDHERIMPRRNDFRSAALLHLLFVHRQHLSEWLFASRVLAQSLTQEGSIENAVIQTLAPIYPTVISFQSCR